MADGGRIEGKGGGPVGLDDIPLDADIGSSEGLSLDYIARIRTAYLVSQNQSMVTQTQFADAKAGAFLAFIGLMATRGPGAVTDLATVTPVTALLVALHGIALGLCLMAIIPRYSSHDLRREITKTERFSWVALSAPGYIADDHAEFVRHADLSQLIYCLARSNHALANVLARKFAILRWAFIVGVLDIGVMVLRTGL